MSARLIPLRRADTCTICDRALPVSTEAWWDPAVRTVTCAACHAATGDTEESPMGPEDAGSAGVSAHREAERRRQVREERVRSKHPRIGGFLLAVTGDPQSTRVWDRGAHGEERVGAILDRFAEQGLLRVLHDRRIPGSRANIDHIAICRFGVVVVDTKNYTGRVEQRRSGSLFRPGPMKLYVNGRDRTRLLDGVRDQVEVVTAAVESLTGQHSFPVTGSLCFWNADFPALVKPYDFEGVTVHWPRSLAKMLRSDGHLDTNTIDDIAATLSKALRPA